VKNSASSLRVVLTHVYAWPEVRRGGERNLHELAAALGDAGHRVSILSTAPTPGRGRILGVDVTYLRRRGRALSRRFGEQSDEVSFAMQASARLATRRFDVWHAFGTADAAAAALLSRSRGITSVYTDLGISERHWREQRPDRRLYDIVLRHLDRYICYSEAAAASVRRDYGREVHVIGGGVDTRTYRPAETGARNPEPVLLFPSTVVDPRKNFPLLLVAFALLRHRRPDAELWHVGPGDAAPFLDEAPAAAREATRSLGVVSPEELIGLYGRSWVTVLPSRGEAFGMVVVESLACGRPAVVLADAGSAELVPPGTGFACEATPEALADAFERALEMAELPETVDACRAAAEPYDWRTGIVPKVEALYRGV
jgi:glycosyltransferase involved in cell wall biosynthesis